MTPPSYTAQTNWICVSTNFNKRPKEKMMTIDYAMSWEFIHMWLRSHPEIGTLCRDGEAVFYVYPAGGEYRELKAFETP